MDKEALSLKVHSMTKESMEITSIAYQDVLTGVKNRYSLYRKMDHLIKHHQAFAVVFIDLDNFKGINDRYDHSVGDQYLKAFAKALQETLKETGEVFRFAGDEFVGIITQDLTYIDKTLMYREVVSNLELDVEFLGFSCGIAQYPLDASTADDLINVADVNMYKVKKIKQIRR